MENLQQQIAALNERNTRVEKDKAWETSLSRKICISLITYVFASLALFLMQVENFWLSALIPVLGYIVSTLSLPYARKLWEKGSR